MLMVNGTPQDYQPNLSVGQLLVRAGLDPTRVAVEVNGIIIAREAFDATLLHDEDKVEIVHFVGGG